MLLKISNEKRRELILQGNICQAITFLSIPAIIFGLLQTLIPLIDNYFINRYGSIAIASSITYSNHFINLVLSIAVGISSATLVLVGESYGQGDRERVRYLASQALFIAIVLGVLAIPVTMGVAWGSSVTVQDPELSKTVFWYITLVSIANCCTFIQVVFNAIKNATSQPEIVLGRLVLTILCKLFFNYLFLAYGRWGTLGIALVSVCTSVLMVLLIFYDLLIKGSGERLSWRLVRWDGTLYQRFWKIAFPLALTSAVVSSGFLLINFQILSFGKYLLTASGIASSINMLALIIPSSIESVIVNAVSVNLGNRNYRRAREIATKGIFFSLVVTGVFVGVVFLLSDFFIPLYTRDPYLMKIVKEALFWYLASCFPFSLILAIQGVFIAVKQNQITFWVSCIRIYILRYLFILVTKEMWGYHSIFGANVISNLGAMVILLLLFYRFRWE